MRKHNPWIIGLIVFFTFVCGFCQQKVCDAMWVSGITLDGKLDEPAWTKLKADPALLQAVKPIPEQLPPGYGTVDNDADLSAEFLVAWDATYFYCVSWYHDDIHFDPRSKDVTQVVQCWEDDGHEWWIDVDYADIATDQIPEYYGNYGWQMMQGFNLTNGTPERIAMAYYHDEMGAAAGYGVSTQVGKEKGFDVPYTTNDGTNFECEASFKWASDLMNQKANAANGDEIAFSIGVNDDDDGLGASGTGCGYERWIGVTPQANTDGWGKITLKGGPAGKTIPVVSMKKTNLNQEVKGIFDIYGRRIHEANSLNQRGIHFITQGNEKAVKQIVVR